ncbi:MAG: transposase [Candidatus Marinimicrobia bacterium]|nr:transposase [Candidatus Neomarinimicrobiota bacterium]
MKNLNSTAIKIGGTTNHLHILNIFSRTISIGEMIGTIKKDSSKWIKTKGKNYHDFHWQNGYGVFSIAQSQVDAVEKYIEDQKEHHKKMTFQEEYRKFLHKYNVDYDERYVWD